MGEFLLVILVMALAFGAYWAMVLFPKQRAFQQRQRTVRALNRGDEVVTFGGIVGKVVEIDGEMGIAHVEISDGVVIRLITAAVMQVYDSEEVARNARAGTSAAPNSES